MAGQPDTLLGYPVVEAEDMPDVAADSLSVAFGNFRAGYLIAERTETQILRDPYTNKPFVHFYATKRVGGQVANSEAIKLLKFARLTGRLPGRPTPPAPRRRRQRPHFQRYGPMTLFFADLVREACQATGAGDLALAGALPGHRRFADAVPAGARFHYCIAGVTEPRNGRRARARSAAAARWRARRSLRPRAALPSISRRG